MEKLDEKRRMILQEAGIMAADKQGTISDLLEIIPKYMYRTEYSHTVQYGFTMHYGYNCCNARYEFGKHGYIYQVSGKDMPETLFEMIVKLVHKEEQLLNQR